MPMPLTLTQQLRPTPQNSRTKPLVPCRHRRLLFLFSAALVLVVVGTVGRIGMQHKFLRDQMGRIMSSRMSPDLLPDPTTLELVLQKRDRASREFAFGFLNNQMTSNHHPEQPFVRILWMYWEQGADHLESLARSGRGKYAADYACVQAWKILNPTWEIHLLNKTVAVKLAPKFSILTEDTSGRHNAVKRSNVLRLELLSRYGGVWSDTSNCPFRPLDEFVPKMIVGQQGFFAHAYPEKWFAGNVTGPDLRKYANCHKLPLFSFDINQARARSCDTWFLIAARPHHVLVEGWLDYLFRRKVRILRMRSCWNRECFYPYFLAQCTITQARMENSTLAAAWIEFLNTNPLRHRRKTGERDGYCNGLLEITRNNVDRTKRECTFVKKQEGDLASLLCWLPRLVAPTPRRQQAIQKERKKQWTVHNMNREEPSSSSGLGQSTNDAGARDLAGTVVLDDAQESHAGVVCC